MTNDQLSLAWDEAAQYSDPDAFVSDLLLSSAFLPEDPDAQPDLSLAPALRAVWTACCGSFRELLQLIHETQSSLSRRFDIPMRTVQGWALGERQCPPYVRRMILELSGVLATVK